MRSIEISRSEAEDLVTLIDAQPEPTALDELAVYIREKFGMSTKEREAAYVASLKLEGER